MRCLFSLSLSLALFVAGPVSALPPGWAWPTPYLSFLEGEPEGTYLQPTVSGRLESALFGCTRNKGTRFHEGVDLKPVERDARGHALDDIYAIAPGEVVYVNRDPALSSYGRYVVIEHNHLDLPLVSLYAHLASVEKRWQPGRAIEAGDRLGRMGHSASYTIPPTRAHLHLEIGLRLGNLESFQPWYEETYPDEDNDHGLWSGLNLLGFDPLPFFAWLDGQSGRVTVSQYVRALPVATVVRVWREEQPDFLERHPALVLGGRPAIAPDGWEISLTAWGLPIRWAPLDRRQTSYRDELDFIFLNTALRDAWTCRTLVTPTADGFRPGRNLLSLLAILYGEPFEDRSYPKRD